jgi:hypothetical protein
MFYIGVTLTVASVIYGHIAPFFYHRPGPKTTLLTDQSPWKVSLLPNERGTKIEKVSFSYTLRF